MYIDICVYRLKSDTLCMMCTEIQMILLDILSVM